MDQKDNSNDIDVEEESLGIISMECYFPKLYVSQSDLEKHDGVSAGKYTIGLGQDSMSFVTDREDICSISMTVLSNLLEKNSIEYKDVGWICVATETILDHSKSISSMLMQLFHDHNHYDIEGIDVKHACYGGTFALFSAFERLHSRYWDGRYCVVISADIAEYEEGPARPSGGCGAVALLLGKGGCLDLAVPRASVKRNEYDFFKPHLDSPYPVVDGPLSNRCYLDALDSCFTAYRAKLKQLDIDWNPIDLGNDDEEAESSKSPDFWIFHAPYNKLVTKTFGRVVYRHFLSDPALYYQHFAQNPEALQFLRKYEKTPFSETISSREVIKGFERLSKPWYTEYVAPSTCLPKAVGNCYTASIFMGLLSLIVDCGKEDIDSLMGRDIQMFAYGSGTIASLYSLKVIDSQSAKRQIAKIVENNDIGMRLAERTRVSCNEYTDILNEKRDRFRSHCQRAKSGDFVPKSPIDVEHFYPGSFYLERVDAQKRRFYAKFEPKPEVEIVEMKQADPVKPSLKVKMKHVDPPIEIVEDIHSLEESKFEIPNLGHFIGDAVLIGAQKVLDKAQDHGLSTKGAIQIDKVLTKSHKVATRCSNS